MNVLAIADYMKQFPESKATVTGFADNGTGSRDINLRLAKQRAEAVAKQLIEKYGISRDRLTVSSMQVRNNRSKQTTGTVLSLSSPTNQYIFIRGHHSSQ